MKKLFLSLALMTFIGVSAVSAYGVYVNGNAGSSYVKADDDDDKTKKAGEITKKECCVKKKACCKTKDGSAKACAGKEGKTEAKVETETSESKTEAPATTGDEK